MLFVPFLSFHYTFFMSSPTATSVLSQGYRAIPQLFFTDNFHYKFKSSHASKARLQSSKLTGARNNLTQNGHNTRSLKKGDKGLSNLAFFAKVPTTKRLRKIRSFSRGFQYSADHGIHGPLPHISDGVCKHTLQ